MKQKTPSPSLLHDVAAVAGLYRNVLWMMRQQLRHGPDWQQHLMEESMRLPQPPAPGDEREVELAGSRHN